MKQLLSSLAFIATLLVFSVLEAASQKNPSAVEVLQKVAAKLASVKVLGYTYTRELNYSSEGYLSKSTAASYLDLKEGPLGFKYQFNDDEYIAVYNGSESFVAAKKRKIMVVTNNPTADRLHSSSSLYNSPLTLKKVLPKIIADTNIAKTSSVDRAGQYEVEFSLHNASISGLGEIRELRQPRVSIYRLTIDSKTYLPIEVLLANDKNRDFTKTTFTNVTENPQAPSDLSWYFSTYTNEYKIQEQVERKLLAVGQTPPSFVLRELESNAQVSLDKHKGKVVLLEFWIAHCGFCIAAVPKLNLIAKAYAGPQFELVSVNVHDDAPTIAAFKKRNNPSYAILTRGESTANSYGVGAYPAIILIGKDGKIAYSSLGLFEKELEPAIKASLEK